MVRNVSQLTRGMRHRCHATPTPTPTYLQRCGEYLPTSALPVLRAGHRHIRKPLGRVKRQNRRVRAVHASAEGNVFFCFSIVAVKYEAVGLHWHVFNEKRMRRQLGCAAAAAACVLGISSQGRGLRCWCRRRCPRPHSHQRRRRR
jgi:hypothetical protein